MSAQREQRLAQTFMTLSNTLVDDFDVLDFMTVLAERAAELLQVTAAGVLLSDQRGGWRPIAASSEDAWLLELLATQAHEGPCQECIATGEPVTSADLAAEHARWPTFIDSARTHGFAAAAAVPMRLRREPIGALTLLNTEPGAVEAESVQMGQALAEVATLGILHHQSSRRRDLLAEQLQATLHNRIVVEQAKGALAEAGQLDMREAFEVLRSYSRATGQLLTELARDVAGDTVDPGTLLAGPPTQTPSSARGEHAHRE